MRASVRNKAFSRGNCSIGIFITRLIESCSLPFTSVNEAFDICAYSKILQ